MDINYLGQITWQSATKELKLWLNVREFQDWTQIDLKPLFE